MRLESKVGTTILVGALGLAVISCPHEAGETLYSTDIESSKVAEFFDREARIMMANSYIDHDQDGDVDVLLVTPRDPIVLSDLKRLTKAYVSGSNDTLAAVRNVLGQEAGVALKIPLKSSSGLFSSIEVEATLMAPLFEREVNRDYAFLNK